MINKLEDNKEYKEAIKRREELQASLKAEKEDLYRTKEKLAILDKTLGIDSVTGQPAWDKIEDCKRACAEHKRKVDILAEEIEKFDQFKKIKDEAKPEIIKAGQALNKRFQKALQQLKEASKEYDSLRDLWGGYNKLNPSNPNVESFENVIGPVYARQLAAQMDYYFEAFFKYSKQYQEEKL